MKHFPIAPPDPVDAILFRMEQMGMTKTDMAKYLGSQSRVSEVLSRKRKLTLKMVKSLYKGLKIPAEILLA
jgi:HTH-type transcriptional regulator/antitoxin HigA